MDIYTIRRENLRACAESVGGQTALAEKLEKSTAQVSHLIGKNPARNIGRAIAREVEQVFGLPFGWMDHPHDQTLRDAQGTYGPKRRTERLFNGITVMGDTRSGPNAQWESAGFPTEVGEEYLETESLDANAYALRVKGNEMSPRLREGDGLLLEPNRLPAPGDEVVVRMIDGRFLTRELVTIGDDAVTLRGIAANERLVIPRDEISYMHYIAGVFRPGSLKKRSIAKA